jgi:hypothetical protein
MLDCVIDPFDVVGWSMAELMVFDVVDLKG